MSMDQMLAGFFGTSGGGEASTEDAEKVAQVEFFNKMAADAGIDLSTLPPAKIEWLWQQTFNKEAADGGDEDEKKKKLEEAARKEHDEKKEASDLFNQGTFFGKTAAHAYVAEMKEIIGAGGLDFMKEAGFKERAADLGRRARKSVEKGLGRVGSHVASIGGKGGEAGKTREYLMKHPKATGAAAIGAGAAAAGGAAAGAHHLFKKKEASEGLSAFEEAAAELALDKVAAAEFDRDQAITRLNAVLTLGLGESEKVASLERYEDALERRALEYAAAAGYPVEWAQ